ncbi:hypothetical protein HBI56_147690 [Parastagonospora nodorum]|uniref:Uncharacterized protein n=1 Tax=Phaeosphaeria nodorum (strain SN15 / ATCC MYA-4574 / FGSC 10173) TaxID=321614 RepID=A0A7U2NQP5_PHANO|nr:hypothetical protein HBH56_077170 [Parastagonospora nodorum]QRD06931.1 hypothetical protein JI435_446590 [Parastagonospora nodorum SN15]KAH3923410.1 hypothetical protein HBH54_210790 [Parastagonospora nodorum]KAH3952030.1 hypothetical protein HBH53_050960 [Parastagonospora nodorum]KAH3981717.1 hypothetical protein HBH51_044120 [Parastagonospora nodorum]
MEYHSSGISLIVSCFIDVPENDVVTPAKSVPSQTMVASYTQNWNLGDVTFK